MKNYNIIKAIIYIPKQFQLGEQSFISLVKETGYFNDNIELNELDLVYLLNEFPDVVENWLQWSDNKRTSSGWFFQKNGEKYSVSYFPNRVEYETIVFRDEGTACAFFIKKEIDSLTKYTL